MGVYGIELPLIRPWTSQPVIIDIVSELFDLTTRLVVSAAADTRPSYEKTEAKAQLPQLASILFMCYDERVQWLGTPLALDEVGSDADKVALERKFKQARSEVLETLRTSPRPF